MESSYFMLYRYYSINCTHTVDPTTVVSSPQQPAELLHDTSWWQCLFSYLNMLISTWWGLSVTVFLLISLIYCLCI